MSRYEQPAYSVVALRSEYEVRHYGSYLAAETTVQGDYEATGNEAFRRLAGFIFGRNSDSQRMNMTVPVTHVPLAGGGQLYRFVMERAYSEQSLPRPMDDSVGIVRVPEGHYAVLAFRGGRSERRYRQAEAKLLNAVRRDGVEVVGPVAAAVYDGPFVPSPIRRNEVLVQIAWGVTSSSD